MINATANITFDASQMTATEVVDYLTEVNQRLSADVGEVVEVPQSAVHQQLDRLMMHNPPFAERVKEVHRELQELGYTPTLPKSKGGGQLPSYISYIAADGKNLGNLNSEKFYVMRAALRDELAGREHFAAASRYAHCHLTSASAVQALLQLAQEVAQG